MHSTPLVILALGAALSQATIIKRQNQTTPHPSDNAVEEYFQAVCLPVSSSQEPDYNAPCWQLQVIEEQCVYGSEAYWNQSSYTNSSSYGTDAPELSPRAQQICVCESEFFQAVQGCVACADKHGLVGAIPDFAPSAVTSFSSSYCAVTNTASVDFASALEAGFAVYESSSYPIQTATTYTDPIGNRTEVSLYYTATVTGSAAYVVSQATGSTTASATLNTVSGQIVPTAAATTTTTRTGAAMATAVVDKLAVAGLMGLAAVVAAL